jgi:hypothetical protein
VLVVARVAGADVAAVLAMRTVVGALIAAAVGIHCSAPPEDTGISAPELTAPAPPPAASARPSEPPASSDGDGVGKPSDHLERKVPDFSALIRDTATTRVTSSVVDPITGATYATGTFVDDALIGDTLVKSRGDKDVFLLKVDPTGAFEWVRAVGSAYAESEPRVTLSGVEVNVIGMTMGAMDCGAGPLPTWSSDTFFFCVFGATDGTSLSGGVFPTGKP